MNDFNLWEKVKLPPELLERLNAMIRRIRLLQLARGLLATGGVALASILVVMGVDAALVIYSDTVRLCLSLAALALTLLTAYIALWRPLADRITPVRIARVVETRHPELQERISSALELLGAGGGAAAEGSGQLLEILASDAAADITGVSAKSEFRGTTLRPVVISASIVLAVLAAVFIVWPRQSALLFARAVAPGAPLGNLAARGFVVTPGDIVLVEGEGILFTLTAPGESGSRAELCIERKGEPLSVERLQRRFGLDDSEAVFELEMPAVRDSFRYRMRLGNALTRYYSVTAVPPPAHGPFDMLLTYPEYTGLGTTQFTVAAEVRLVAPVGTHAGVRTTLNRKMDAALQIGGRTLSPVERLPADEVTFDWLFEKANGASHWGLVLRDARGFTNAPSWAIYEPVPDYAPHVQLTYPTGNTYTLPTFGLLKLVYALSDDHGLSQTRLAILPDNDRTPWYIDLDPVSVEDGSWSVAHDLSLSEFQLNGARKLRIWLEVSDNLPVHLDGPNASKSRVVAVNLDDGQKRSLADQVRIPEREALTNLLESAARRLEEAARKIANVTNQTDAAVINKAVQEAATVAEEASAEVAKAADTAEKGLFAGLSEDVRDVADTAIEEAKEATEAASEATAEAASEATAEAAPQQPEDEAQRLAREAMEALNAAAEETRELVPEILAKDKVLEEASAIEAAAAEEAREAKKAMERQLTDAEMTAWQAKQEELAEKVEAYDLSNEILDKEEQPVGGEAANEREQGTGNREQGTGNREQGSGVRDQGSEQPSNNATTQPANEQTNQRTNESTNQRTNEAASAARAAAHAADAAKAVDIDENKLKLARQAEAAAKEGKRAATEAQRATEAIKSLERDREALEQIRDTAEAAAKEAEALADDALQVRLEAVREMAQVIPPDVAKAMDLAKRSEALAALADKALKAAEEGHPISPESLAAQAAALRKEAEDLAKAANGNPFLKRSAEMAADVARRAEEAVAGLRAAMREGADEETAQKALEKAAEAAEAAAKASEHAAENAERAANDVRENAVAAADEASEIVREAEQLHEELQKAIAASRAALASGEQVEGQKSNVESPNGRAALDQSGKLPNDATPQRTNEETTKRINEQAAALAARAAEATRQAEAAESAARQRQANMSADMAQKAKQAAAAAQRSAEAAAQAANAELAGQKQQADAREADAKRFAEEAARNAEASQANADILAVPAAEHARRAAEAAKLAADLASGKPVEREQGTGNREQEIGNGERGTGNGEQPNDATMQPSNDAAPERINEQTNKRTNDASAAAEAAAEAAAAAIKAAREAAAAAEKAANERRENLPVEAARAARTAADQAEAALREQGTGNREQGTRNGAQGSNQQANEQTNKRINDALAAAQDAAKAASKAARRAATGPEEHVAELANEGRLASKALDNVADKIADAARIAQESAAEKKEANGDAEKTAAADAKAEEARRLFEDAKREARSIGQGLSQLSAETRPIIANAERVAREEAAALKRIAETSETPLDLPEKLPGEIALQGARDIQQLFDNNRRIANDLEHIGNWGMHNPSEAIRQSENLSSRAEQAAQRAEDIAATPGIRSARGTDEGTGNREQGIENGEWGTGNGEPPNDTMAQHPNDATVQRFNGPTVQRSNGPMPTAETAALADQLASARQQIDAARSMLASGEQMESPDGRTVFDQAREQGTGNREQEIWNGERGTGNGEPFNDATMQRPDESTVQRSNGPTVQRSNGPTVQRSNESTVQRSNGSTVQRSNVAAASAAVAADAAAAAASRTAARANSSLTNRQNRAVAALASSEKSTQSAAAAAAKLAESAGKLVAEEALRAAGATPEHSSGESQMSNAESQEGRSSANEITGESMFKLVSHVSAAAGKATAARELAQRSLDGQTSPESLEGRESPEGRAELDQARDQGSGIRDQETGKPTNRQTDELTNRQTVKPSNRQTAEEAASAAAEAAAEADEALRQAKLMQAPTEEQIAAAKEAYKAALAMRKMALEHAEKAGLDTETMKARKTDGGRKRNRDPNRQKKPAPTMKDGNGGGKHDDAEEEEYEDGLSLEMPEWLRKLGFPRSEWLKYKGSLESGLPDGALEKVAPEYRDLVRRYFELLSKEK